MRYDYATRSDGKIAEARDEIERRADRDGNSIAAFRVFQSSTWPPLQKSPTAKGVAHWIVQGFTTQAEADNAEGV